MSLEIPKQPIEDVLDKSKIANSSQSKNIFALVTGLAIIGCLYLNNNPVWDDHSLFLHLNQLSFTDLIYSPVGLGQIGEGYYRPVSMLLMKVGGGPGMVHLFILLFHLITTFLVYQLTDKNWLLAMLFGIHPLASEVLGWSSALPDATATLLAVGALFAITKKHFSLTFLLAFLALLAKENALVLIVLMAIFYKSRLAPLGAIVGYMIIRFLVIGTAGVPFEWDKLLSGAAGVLWLLGSSMFPFTVTPVRDIWHVTTWEMVLGVMVVGFAGRILWRGKRLQKLGAALWVLAPLIALPTIASSHLAAERYMYLGIFGMVLALSSIRIPANKSTFTGILFAFVSIPIHYQQSRAWKSDIALFTQAVEALPNSSYSYHLLGFANLREQHYQQAAVAFERGLQLEHSYPTERLLLMQSLILSGDAPKALHVAQQGPKTGLTAEYIAWWGRAAYEAGQQQRAWQIWQPLLKIDENKTLHILDGPAWFREYIRQAMKTFD